MSCVKAAFFLLLLSCNRSLVKRSPGTGDGVRSPDGKAEAYIKDGAIYVRGLATKENRVVVPANWQNGAYGLDGRSIAWSHDGKMIAFIGQVAYENLMRSLFVARSDGSTWKKVAQNVGLFKWSPTEPKLAFVQINDAGEAPGAASVPEIAAADLETGESISFGMIESGMVRDLEWESPRSIRCVPEDPAAWNGRMTFNIPETFPREPAPARGRYSEWSKPQAPTPVEIPGDEKPIPLLR